MMDRIMNWLKIWPGLWKMLSKARNAIRKHLKKKDIDPKKFTGK